MAGNAIIGALRVVLGLDAAAFSKGASQAQRDAARLGKKLDAIGKGMSNLGQSLSVGLTLPILAFGAASVQAAQQSADAFGQVEAALKSMGDASGRTLAQLGAQADALMHHSLFDDDDIMRNVTANMLTFGNIAGENFDRAQQAVVDMATRLKMDLQPATIMVGKALNDPVKGIAALSRAGIQFTAQQKAQIKAMVAGGNAAGAQAIMLGELNRQFGGAAQAAQNTQPFNQFADALDTLKESIGAKILPVLTPFITSLTGLIEKFSKLSPQMQGFVVGALAIAAALGPILMILGPVVSGIGALLPLLAAISIPALAAAAPFIALAAAIAGLVWLFRNDLAPAMAQFVAFAQRTLGPTLKPLWDSLVEACDAIGDAFQAAFGEGAPLHGVLVFFGGAIKSTFEGVVLIFGGLLKTVTEIFRAIAALFRGDILGALSHLGQAFMELVHGIDAALANAFPDIAKWLSGIAGLAKKWLVDEFHRHVDKVLNDIELVKKGFAALYDAVVGHSYVPDMVEGIQEWFAKLDAVMVAPAKAATSAAAQAFEKLRDDVGAILDGMLTDQQRALREAQANIATLKSYLATPKGKGDATAAAALANLQRNLPAQKIAAEIGPLTPAADMNASDFGSNGYDESWTATSGQLIADAHLAALEASTERIKNILQAGWSELMHGDLKGALAKWFEAWAAKGMESALDSLSQLLAQIFSGMSAGSSGSAGGGTDWVGTALKFLPKLFGFAQGGSFEVGGSGGIDSKIAMMKVTPGETGAIWKKGEGPAGGGGTMVTQRITLQANGDRNIVELVKAASRAAYAQAVAESGRRLPGIAHKNRQLAG